MFWLFKSLFFFNYVAKQLILSKGLILVIAGLDESAAKSVNLEGGIRVTAKLFSFFFCSCRMSL